MAAKGQSRNRIKRVPSDDVQGENSYILIMMPTVGELRKNKKDISRLQRKMERAERKLDRALNNGADEEKIEALEDEFEVAEIKIEMYANASWAQYMIEWNWKNDEGDPLPEPHNNGDVFELLSLTETKFITDQFTVNEDTKKN